MRHILVFCGLIAILLNVSLGQSIEPYISYQGFLADSAGNGITGMVSMKLALYTDSLSGSQVFSQTFQNVPVTKGVYYLSLNVGNLDMSKQYWIETSVEEEILSPRVRMTSMPHAQWCQNFALPYCGIDTSITDTVFRLDNWGVSPNGVFRNMSGNNGMPALIAENKGPGSGLLVKNTGTGIAAEFKIESSSNDSAIVKAERNGIVARIGGKNHEQFDGIDVSSAYGYGIYAASDTNSAIAAQTTSNMPAIDARNHGKGPAIQGMSNTDGGIGVYGISTVVKDIWGYGVKGESKNDGTSGVGGFSYAKGIGVDGEDVGPQGEGGIGVLAYSRFGYALWCNGKFQQQGGQFIVSPTSTIWTTNKPATVKLNSGDIVKLFSEEATEVYFNDYGNGKLSNGRALISLDPKFLQTVTIDDAHPLKVFVQLEGDCNGVYVTNKTTTSFDVVELLHGSSNAAFSYRIVCKRKYYEDERLANQEQDEEINKMVLKTAWPEMGKEQIEKCTRTKSDEINPPRNSANNPDLLVPKY